MKKINNGEKLQFINIFTTFVNSKTITTYEKDTHRYRCYRCRGAGILQLFQEYLQHYGDE